MTETFSVKRQKKHPALYGFKKLLILSLIASIAFLMLYNTLLLPLLSDFAKATATTKVTKEIQDIIKTNSQDNTYGDFIKLKYNSEGNIVSLETQTGNISYISSSITKDVINRISDNNNLYVAIPIGTLSQNALFSGKGPKIKANLTVSPNVTCDIESEFSDAGINQTIHRITAKVNTDIYIRLPFSTEKVTICCKYILAETVIIGKVPEAYTKITRLSEDDDIEESEIDDIFDFGATLD